MATRSPKLAEGGSNAGNHNGEQTAHSLKKEAKLEGGVRPAKGVVKEKVGTVSPALASAFLHTFHRQTPRSCSTPTRRRASRTDRNFSSDTILSARIQRVPVPLTTEQRKPRFQRVVVKKEHGSFSTSPFNEHNGRSVSERVRFTVI